MKNEITREEFKQLHSISCPDWKTKLKEMAIKSMFQDAVSFDDKEIQLMVDASTKEQLPIVKSLFEITDNWKDIKSLGDAINYLGEKDEDVIELQKTNHAGLDSSFITCIVIFKALNQGWKPNWQDENEPKYQIFWNMKTNHYDYWNDYYSASDVPSSLCLKNKELCEHVKEYFSKEYSKYINK